jgi:hypothetical protein
MSERYTPVEVFCSYAHEDEVWLRGVEKHLSLLKRQGRIALWHDRLITPGTDWAKTIDTHLETASIILLFISADFLASDYCYGIEMKRALERQEAGEAQVIPILVRSADWHSAPFGHLQALPTKAKPLATWSDRDTALADVAGGIRRAIEKLPLRTNTLPNNGQAVSKEEDVHDKMDPPLQPQYEEQEPYSDSYQDRMFNKMFIFERQQNAFDLALSRSMPGQGNFTKSYRQARNKKVIDRVMSSLAEACEDCDLWWFVGEQHNPACPIRRLAEEVWLIQHNECKITDLWVYRHPTLERQYVLLHLAPQPSFGLYDRDDANIDWDEAGYYRQRYVVTAQVRWGLAKRCQTR